MPIMFRALRLLPFLYPFGHGLNLPLRREKMGEMKTARSSRRSPRLCLVTGGKQFEINGFFVDVVIGRVPQALRTLRNKVASLNDLVEHERVWTAGITQMGR